MTIYDYVSGKERVENILDNDLKIIEKDKVPSKDNFTFENGYISWVTGLFVDIRDSSSLFSNENNENVSKIIRSFCSEIIEILRDEENIREIGIRGDCVYSIHTTPKERDELKIARLAFWINTYMIMFNKLLVKRDFPQIDVGIGVATSKELVVKAGRKGVGIYDNVWIGNAVSKASKLSSIGNKDDYGPIVFSKESYNYFIRHLDNENTEDAYSWFTEHYDKYLGYFYSANIVKKEFRDWINEKII